MRAAHRFEYGVVASPSGPYFTHGFTPIDIWVEREHHRAGPGGMGDVKTGGNYAASFYAKSHAFERGFDEVLFLDAATNTCIDELGAMNVFVVMADGRVRTLRFLARFCLVPRVLRFWSCWTTTGWR